MKTTYEKVNTFAGSALPWLRDNKERTKFRYALEVVMKRAQPILTKYREAMEDLAVEYAAEDEKTKVLLHDENGGYSYTREQKKAHDKALRNLYHEGEVEIEPHICTGRVPDDLTDAELSAFHEFVLIVKDEEPEAEWRRAA